MHTVAPLLVTLPEPPSHRSTVAAYRLSLEAASQFGLQEGQVIQATIAKENSALILAGKDGRFLQLPTNASAYHSSSTWFRVEFSPYGVYLRPQALPAAAPRPPSQPVAATDVFAPVLDRQGFLRSLFIALSSEGARTYEPMMRRLLTLFRQDPGIASLIKKFLIASDDLSPLLVYRALLSSGVLGTVPSRPDLPSLLRMLEDRSRKSTMSGVFDTASDELHAAAIRLDAAHYEAVQARNWGDGWFRFPLLFEDRPPVEVLVRKSRQGSGQAGSWSVDLDVAMQKELVLSLSFQLSAGHSVSVVAWIAKTEFAELLRTCVPDLRARLDDFGIGLDSCVIYAGERPRQDPPNNVVVGQVP
ncbi:MAG: hypothetical protein RLZZ169_711 [Pseudomonadota bacterium]